MLNFLKNKKGNAATILMVLPIWLLLILVAMYEIEIATCRNELEDDARVALRIASISENYEMALMNASQYLVALDDGYTALTESNLKMYSNDNNPIEEPDDPSFWRSGNILEISVTKKTSYFGSVALDMCSLDKSQCGPIVPTTVTTVLRMYITVD